MKRSGAWPSPYIPCLPTSKNSSNSGLGSLSNLPSSPTMETRLFGRDEAREMWRTLRSQRSSRRRAPRRRSCHLAAVVLGHARLGATSATRPKSSAFCRWPHGTLTNLSAESGGVERRKGRRFEAWCRARHLLTPTPATSTPRRVSGPRSSANRAASSAARITTNFATRNALAEAPRLAHRSAAFRSGFGTPRTAPTQRTSEPDAGGAHVAGSARAKSANDAGRCGSGCFFGSDGARSWFLCAERA